MIRCRNCLISLVNQRSRLGLIFSSRNLCASNETSQKTNADDERKKEEKHEQYVKRAMILAGSFENMQNKDKSNYLDMIRVFEDKDVHRRNHVEFIYAALKVIFFRL